MPKKKRRATVEVACDPCWTLQAWAEFIQEQILKFGPRSLLKTDAGNNNVELVVETRE